MATSLHAARLEAGRRVFTRILVGVDDSQQALEAARQAAVLQDVEGRLTLFACWDVLPPSAGGPLTTDRYDVDEELQRKAAEDALLAARDYVSPLSEAAGMLVRGLPAPRLLEEIERGEHTLVAIGGSGTGRLLGIVEGAVATEIVHRAPCSVLVARIGCAPVPERIVVGVDGSVESAAAYAAARHLAERFDAELHTLVAWGGKGVNARLVQTITEGEHDDRDAAPAEALARAASEADLLVLGSRGLHGVRALGSVSERVAHTAGCSTLIVREPVWQRVVEELGR